ncbi:hypothetical protein [Leptothoe spongobia]|uniref:Uncharacterized protein n=1 Tax=Leptothoe spongobia TAU-MAC 1115 TaxID=1967444 RepID=A0A947DEC3_9CYAN|nr:hypothetical protein [Leptothoe spongobia]MBT9315210.1 hypothetical protein [Leptothoe spongobia TAU-MAC 1115]
MKIDTNTLFPGDLTPSATQILGQPTALVTQPVIAQKFEENFFDRSGEILGDFVDSGQLWALLIGVVIGYVIRGITTY